MMPYTVDEHMLYIVVSHVLELFIHVREKIYIYGDFVNQSTLSKEGTLIY